MIERIDVSSRVVHTYITNEQLYTRRSFIHTYAPVYKLFTRWQILSQQHCQNVKASPREIECENKSILIYTKYLRVYFIKTHERIFLMWGIVQYVTFNVTLDILYRTIIAVITRYLLHDNFTNQVYTFKDNYPIILTLRAVID